MSTTEREWPHPPDIAEGHPERIVAFARYEWAKAHLTGTRVAHAASGCNWGHTFLAAPHRVVIAYDIDPAAHEAALAFGYPAVLLADIETRTFEGFDSLVSIETLEHLKEPWAWMSRLDDGVREILLSTPIQPTMHFNRWHRHDWTADEVRARVRELGWTETHCEFLDLPCWEPNPLFILLRATR